MGKLTTENLKKLLSYIRKDSRVVVPPLPGFDSGVHLIDDKFLVVSTDPCIGVPEDQFGWFLIHYVASDIALFGARLEFCTINLLGPPSTDPEVFYEVMKQASETADELGVAVVTGHTGTYNGLSTLIGVCTGYGTVDKDKLITPGDAKPRDRILCTKPIGLELTINLALTRQRQAEGLFGVQRTRQLADLVNGQSCVREALALAQIDGVHAMHDATEGGLTVALNEMAEASKVGFKVEWERIQFPEEAQKLQRLFMLSDEQVLSMSSTGTILVAVHPEAKRRVEEVLRHNDISAFDIGFFTENLEHILVKNSREHPFPRKANDPYEKILFGQ